MTLDTNDLRGAFEHDVAELTQVPDFSSVAASRGRRTQRVRALAGTASVAVLVAAVLGLSQGSLWSHKTATAASPKGFVAYANGMKLIAGHEGGSQLSFDVTLPATADGKPAPVGFSLGCASPKADPTHLKGKVNLVINGQPQGSVSGCGKVFPSGPAYMISWDPKDKAYSPGSTLHVGVAVTGMSTADARLRVGAYQGVPISEYVFPPRPAQLTPIRDAIHLGNYTYISTVSATKPQPVVVSPKRGLVFGVATTEPGQLDILVNGKVVTTVNSWVYTPEGVGPTAFSLKALHLKAGEPVTVSVVPTRYTGDTWRVDIADSATP